MPMQSRTSMEAVEAMHDAIEKLKAKCATIKQLKRKNADAIFIYSIHHYEPDREDMLAIAKYGDTYAVYAPDSLSEEQYSVFGFLIRDMEPQDKLVVFQQESYNAIGKYSYGRPVNVQLHV